MVVNPHSPRAVFNHIALTVLNRVNEPLPAEVTLTPENIVAFWHYPADSNDTSPQYDARELWHRATARLREIGAPMDAQVTSCRKPGRVKMNIWMNNAREIRIRIEEGDPLPRPEELESRRGLKPGQPNLLNAVDVGEIISSHLLYGGRKKGSDEDAA
jgi:hypothetical protein